MNTIDSVKVYFNLNEKKKISSNCKFVLKNRSIFDLFFESSFCSINKMFTAVQNDFPDYYIEIKDNRLHIYEANCCEELVIGSLLIDFEIIKMIETNKFINAVIFENCNSKITISQVIDD